MSVSDSGREPPPVPWVLPGLDRPGDGAVHRGRTAAGHSFQTPALTEEEARNIAARVREAALTARRERSVDEVIEAVAAAATDLADPDTPPGRRTRRILGAELGWGEELIEETLDGMASGWDADSLGALMDGELGDRRLVDGFLAAGEVEGVARARHASGPAALFQVQAGNVPGVGVTGVVRGLLVRSGVLVKTAREEPGLAAEFARSLGSRDELLGRCVAVTWWPGGGPDPAASVWAEAAGAAVVYGGTTAVAGLRASLPAGCPLVVYGPKIGAGVVLPDADLEEAARDVARDVCAYEQRGCVSPRLVFAVPEARRTPFAEALHAALGEEVKRRGRRGLVPAEAGRIRALRAEVDLGARGEDTRVLGDPAEVGWTVITSGKPALETEALPRVVRVSGAADLSALGQALAPLEGRIQAVGYGGEEGARDLARLAARLGACRVAPLGTLAWPPPDWRHDGRHQLLPLLRWTELEGRG